MAHLNLRYGIYRGATPDLLLLKLGFLNIKVCKFNSQEFEAFVKSLNRSTQYHLLDEIRDHLDHQNQLQAELYAFIPLRKTTAIPELLFHQIAQVLLILFPSDFKLICIAGLGKENVERDFINPYYLSYEYIVQRLSRPGGDLLSIKTRGNINHINSFIRRFFSRYADLHYLHLAIDYYYTAFSQMSIYMAYLNYFMALESLNDGTTELTHRISRLAAVINANSKKEGQTIISNFSKFYALRSKIVHGSDLSTSGPKVKLYYYPVQSLVSRTLIELIEQNFESKESMNKTVVESGFGDKKKLNKGYRNHSLNAEVSKRIAVDITTT